MLDWLSAHGVIKDPREAWTLSNSWVSVTFVSIFMLGRLSAERSLSKRIEKLEQEK